MVKYFLWLIPCFCVLTVAGQKANYKQADRFVSSKTGALVGSTQVTPRFFKDSEAFWYMYKTGEGEHYYYVDPKTKTHRELFDRNWMAGELTKETHKAINSRELKLQMSNAKDRNHILEFKVDTFRFEFDVHKRSLIRVDSVRKPKEDDKKPPKRPLVGSYSPDSTYVVYAKGHNLYVKNLKDSLEVQLTTDGELNYSFGGRGGLWRNERDTTRNRDTDRNRNTDRSANATPTVPSITWFDDSRHFCVQREDVRKVENLFVVNTLGNERPRLMQYRYAMAGDKEVAQNELFLFNVESKERVKVPIEKWADQTIRLYPVKQKQEDRGISQLYFLRKKRTNDEVDICRVDRRTGAVTIIINEESKPYFNNDFFHLSFLNGGKDILWWSERTGYEIGRAHV